MTYVMLYKTKVRSDRIEKMKEVSAKFFELYQEHGIKVIGHWTRIDKPTTNYLMTEYESEADYITKVEKLRADPRYQELSKELEHYRKGFKMKRLQPSDVMVENLLMH